MARSVADEAAVLLGPEDAAFDRLPSEPSGALEALRRLARAEARGRLGHALLVAGPRGSGKRWCAVRLAQLTACPAAVGSGDEPSLPCLACSDCRKAEAGLDPDVFLLEPGKDPKTRRQRAEIAVDQVRHLQERLSFRGAGRRRIAIVDPADRLSLVAQEALLKTLEEPPAAVTLVLLTARPSSLKPTVRSRCHVVRVAAPSRRALAQVVGEVTGTTPASARLAAALSGGDLRRALELDADAAAEEWLSAARSLYELLGRRGEARARDLAQEAVPRRGGEDGGSRESVTAWLDLLERIVRDVMIAGATPHEKHAESLLHAEGSKAARSLAERLPPAAAARALDEVQRARDDLARHLSPRLVLTSLLLELHVLGIRLAGPGGR